MSNSMFLMFSLRKKEKKKKDYPSVQSSITTVHSYVSDLHSRHVLRFGLHYWAGIVRAPISFGLHRI